MAEGSFPRIAQACLADCVREPDAEPNEDAWTLDKVKFIRFMHDHVLKPMHGRPLAVVLSGPRIYIQQDKADPTRKYVAITFSHSVAVAGWTMCPIELFREVNADPEMINHPPPGLHTFDCHISLGSWRWTRGVATGLRNDGEALLAGREFRCICIANMDYAHSQSYFWDVCPCSVECLSVLKSVSEIFASKACKEQDRVCRQASHHLWRDPLINDW